MSMRWAGYASPSARSGSKGFADQTRQAMEEAQPGDVLQRWSYAIEWTEDCMKPSQLELWRARSDDLADHAVAYFDLKPGQDSFAVISQYMADTSLEKQDAQVAHLWQSIHQLPPIGVTSMCPGETAQQARELNNRYPSPSLAQGQAVFARYSGQIFIALMQYSLTAGFSSVRLTSVLRETGYLTGSKDVTYRRLLETTQFVMDCMATMDVGSTGWKSAFRVRMLHGQVRRRIMSNKGLLKKYQHELDGVPINQEDLLATLGGFSVGPLWCLRRMNVRLTRAEEEAYIAAWRHIGWYLGLDADLLARHFASLETAEKIFDCVTKHLFLDLTLVDSEQESSSYRILSSVVGRPPTGETMDSLLSMSRLLIGDELSDHLGLHASVKLTSRIRRDVRIYTQRYLLFFGAHYRKGWEIERQRLFRVLINMLIAWQLGSRRTKFTQKDERNTETKDDHDDNLGDVTLGKEAGTKAIRSWRLMLGECAIVSIGIGAIVAYVAFKALVNM